MNVTTATMTKIIVGVTVLAILFAGIGFALTYNASTSVTDNTIEAKYIKVTTKNGDSADYTDFLDTVDYNTVNDAGTIKYSPINDVRIDGVAVDGEHPADAQQISTANWKVAVEKTGFASEQTYNMDVTVSNFTPVAGLTYTLKVGTQTATYTDSKWSFTGLTTSSSALDVKLFVSGTATASSETAGFTNNTSVFTFTAQVTTV